MCATDLGLRGGSGLIKTRNIMKRQSNLSERITINPKVMVGKPARRPQPLETCALLLNKY